ncbi:myb-like protein P [Lucilia sericata]|uniref:myb-like protein P n=1 Tax=Lucilia sericata TaxID=13632 RepID=UPI0018A7E86B|nr:myb-like protein P [Lucilia sericata]XP_037807446.1 myb-like protein P [Lucilia sericata]
MTCDKQNENFITQQQMREDNKFNSKNIANTIISHNSSRKSNKFDKAKSLQNARLMMLEFSPLKAEAQPRNRTKTSFRKQTIISKVSKQEVSTMAQQALKRTHMTLKEYFEFSNATNTPTTTKNKTTASKTINKNMYVKQREQNIDQRSSTINSGKQQYQLKLWPTIASTTDPTEIIRNLETISSSSISSSLLPTTTTELVVAATAEALTIPVTGDVVENSQSKIKQCNNVCISSKCGSKQKCTQKQQQQQHKHKQHCKSANICSSTNNFNNIRTFNKSNININITDASSTDAASTYPPATKTVEEDTRNTNINTTTSTTNKANIILNTISTTTTTIHHAHTDDIATTTENTTAVVTATRPTELSTLTSAAVAATTYCKAFPLRQRFYQNTKQLECLLRTVVFSFMFVMSMQYQTVSASTSMMSKHEPMFISRSETFKFVAGDTIVLPCEVANTGE